MKRGNELGYFAYGGSTIVALWPKGLIKCVSSSPYSTNVLSVNMNAHANALFWSCAL